jgi:hypothetical protein
MHRSGTSAMTRTLSLLGAALPKCIMPAQFDNPTGFWEPQSVADLNDEILRALDSEWDDVFSFRPRNYLSNFDHFYLGRAVDLLEQEYNGSEVIVLKEPRISVLTSFWNRALRKAGYTTHYIVMVRNPLEVVDSLLVRNSFPREKSLLLWSSYMLALERDTREERRTFVAFEQIMSDWRAVRDRIQDDAGLPFFRDTPAAAVDIDRFIDGRLRHHEVTPEDLSSRSDVPEEVKTLYRIFSGACYGQEINPAAVEAVRLELEKVDTLIGPVLADLGQRARSLTKDVLELQQAHASAVERADAVTELLSAAEAERNGLAEAASQRDALLEEAAHLTASLAEAADQGERHRVEIQLLVERLAGSEQLHDKLQLRENELRQRQEEIEQTRSELEKDRSELARVRAELAQTRSERDDLAFRLTELDGAKAAAEASEAKLAERLQELARITELLRARENELKAEKSAAEVRLGERFREIATLTSMLTEREAQARQSSEEAAWLMEVTSLLANGSTTSKGRLLALLPASLQEKRHRRILKRRSLFDGEAYLAANPDVAAEGQDPLAHYLRHGIKENRPRG